MRGDGAPFGWLYHVCGCALVACEACVSNTVSMPIVAADRKRGPASKMAFVCAVTCRRFVRYTQYPRARACPLRIQKE